MKFRSFILILLLVAACRSSQPGSGGGVPLRGRVVDPHGKAVAGVRVEGGGSITTTDARGEFALTAAPSPRLAVSFSAPRFVNTTRIFPDASRSGINTVVIWPRSAAVTIDATGGTIPFASGGSIAIPANSLADPQGRAVSGPVDVSVTYFDVSDRARLLAVPGDFTARMRDGSQRRLQSYGVFEIAASDRAGNRIDLARGRNAAVRIPIPRAFAGRTPRTIGSYSFDTAQAVWVEEGTLLLDDLVYTGTIDRFDWSWNADEPVDTTCMTFLVLSPGINPQPLPGAKVEATGVDYGSVSYGYTNADGLVCLLVKRNAQIELKAIGTIPTWRSQTETVTSPDIASGPGDCGDPTKCPRTTIQLDVIVGTTPIP
jgi:hypothetical protein